jgi:hypothetical protein
MVAGMLFMGTASSLNITVNHLTKDISTRIHGFTFFIEFLNFSECGIDDSFKERAISKVIRPSPNEITTNQSKYKCT